MTSAPPSRRLLTGPLACAALTACTLAFCSTFSVANAQSGGFVATLGTDTVHLERFTLENGTYRGTIITRIPQTRVVRYTLTPGAGGQVTNYTMETFDANGAAIRTNGAAGSMSYANDTLIRVSLKDGLPDTTRIRATRAAYPSPSIPYVGVTFLTYELAFANMDVARDTLIYQITMVPQQVRLAPTRAWLVDADSAELNYFGVAKSGYKFDAQGQLLRADWRNTTYRYRIARITAPDIESKIKQWADADQRGVGIGALSPRDTARSAFGGADFSIEYSRPSARGRDIWRQVVPIGQVWRLGADVATHFTTSRDIRIGGADVAAGTYTLWMLPTADGSAQLIINRKTGIFGTQYNPANDLVRVPLTRTTTQGAERLTLLLENGHFAIAWGNTTWRVPVSVK